MNPRMPDYELALFHAKQFARVMAFISEKQYIFESIRLPSLITIEINGSVCEVEIHIPDESWNPNYKSVPGVEMDRDAQKLFAKFEVTRP